MSVLAGFTLANVFAAAVIEGGMHIAVHYFPPMTNLMLNIAPVVTAPLSFIWEHAVDPAFEFLGLEGAFKRAPGEEAFAQNFLDY